MSPDQIVQIAAGIALATTAATAALAVFVGRRITHEGAETRRLTAVVRTRLGALVAVERDRRGR